jgi:hypothetical protein
VDEKIVDIFNKSIKNQIDIFRILLSELSSNSSKIPKIRKILSMC